MRKGAHGALSHCVLRFLNLDLASPAAPTAAESWEGMLSACIMAGVAYVALPVAGLIPMEVVEPFLSAPWKRPCVTVMRIEAVVDVAVEAVVAMEPWASAEKYPADKPVGAIVAIGRTVIRSVIKVPIRAHRSHTNADGNLGWA